MKKFLWLAALLCINVSVFAQQLISISPTFATANDNNVVITFDASQGNAGLLGESIIYAHTGVITSASTSGTDWKYVLTDWTTNLPKALLTRVGSTNQYTLNIGNIRTYYGIPANETVLKLAFVFRNATGTKTGKTTSNGDIFIDINQGVYQVKMASPLKATFYNAGDTVKVSANASAKSNLKLFANGTEIVSVSNDSVLSYSAVFSSFGSNRVNLVLQGNNNGQMAYDTSYILQRGTPNIAMAPAGTKDGINYINDSTVILQLYAPLKQFVYVIGDFTNWEFMPEMLMNKTPDNSRYWITVTGLSKGVEYGFQYVIDEGQMRVADVYADKILDPWNDQWISKETYPNLKPYPTGKTTEIVSVLQTGQTPFNWTTTNYTKPHKDKLIIYELLVRDFVGKHDYKTLKDTLSYFKNLGINCIQLMPIMEFEGNESWGYNPMFFFAPDKYYGTKDDLKAFIDACHKEGIAVVLDIALNHSFGQNPQVRMYFNPAAGQFGQPTAQNPWFNQTDRHPFGVGYDYNHEATVVQNFTDRVIKYWIEEYKIDGYRFDLSKGFTQKNTGTDVAAWNAFDQSRVNIWNRIRTEILKYAPDAYLILEHLGDNSEEKVLADMGFMLWGKMTENYAEAMMGYNNSKANLSWGNYKTRSFASPNLITYAESHDEERVMFTTLTYGNSNANYSTKTLDNALRRVAAYHALLLPLKGPKMLWQGGELGYEVSINTNGRTGNKPFRWQYITDVKRMRVYHEVGAMARLKQHEALQSDNYVYDVAGMVKTLRITHDSMNVFIAANFDLVPATTNLNAQSFDWWYNYITGDSIPANLLLNLNIAPGDYVIYTSKKVLSNLPLSIARVETSEAFNIYPNPFKSEFFVLSEKEKIEQVFLTDMQGKQVMVEPTFVNAQQVSLSLDGLKAGVYCMTIVSKAGSQTFKVLKQD
jgi:1,4-alpha-glucan branching enzyme